jgi:deoxyinosine 3'endonuclease (endonuclease V)
MLDELVLGTRLSLPNNRPLFVSVGHRVSLKTAVEIVRRATEDKTRDPLKIADRLSKEQRKEGTEAG